MATKKLSIALTEAINLPGDVVKVGTYTATATDYLIVCNSAGAMDIDLPVATGSHKMLKIKNIGAGDVTIDPDGADHIDGVDTATVHQWDSVEIIDYAANNWVIT
jgi:hypothetical protein